VQKPFKVYTCLAVSKKKKVFWVCTLSSGLCFQVLKSLARAVVHQPSTWTQELGCTQMFADPTDGENSENYVMWTVHGQPAEVYFGLWLLQFSVYSFSYHFSPVITTHLQMRGFVAAKSHCVSLFQHLCLY